MIYAVGFEYSSTEATSPAIYNKSLEYMHLKFNNISKPIIIFQSFCIHSYEVICLKMHLSNFHVACLLCAVALAVPTTSLSSPTHVDSAPNPIGTLYPNSVTGTINGTIAVVPIPYSLARELIPSQYGILKKAYKSALPGFPHDMYPVSKSATVRIANIATDNPRAS